jgi:hypothetical protein
MLEKNEGAIENGQSRDRSNIGHKTYLRRQAKQKQHRKQKG